MKKVLFAVVAGFILLSGCEKSENVVDFPHHSSRIVINSIFTNGEIPVINVSKSLSALDNLMNAPLKDAVIIMYKDGVKQNFNFQHLGEGVYMPTGDDTLEAGAHYKIEVSSGKLPDASATDKIPVTPVINNINFKVSDTSFYASLDVDYSYHHGNIRGYVTFNIEDIPGEENFYEISIHYESDLYNFDSTEVETVTNPMYHITSQNPAVDEILMQSILVTDKMFDGQSREININLGNDYGYVDLKADSKIYLKVVSLTKDTYLYKKTFGVYTQNMGDPFAEPVRVHNNIQNGYGIFSGYSEGIFLMNW